MKTFFFLFLLPLQLLAQTDQGLEKDITGLWKGTVITRELNLPYELIITRHNGILTGYSHTTFTVRGEEIVSVKKLVVTFKKDHIVIEDEDLLFNNFNEEAPKKIKQTNKVSLETNGKVWRLYGTFEAKAPRMLKPADGTVELEKKESPAGTKLYAKLGELNLSNTISFTFTNAEQTAAVAVIDNPVTEKSNASPEVTDYGKRVTIPADTVAMVKNIPSTLPATGSPDQNKNLLVTQENSVIILPPPVVMNVSKISGVVVSKPTPVKKTVTALKIINSNAKIAPLETGAPKTTSTPATGVAAGTIAKTTVPTSAAPGKPSAVIKQPTPSNPVAVSKPIAVPPKPIPPVTAKATPVIKTTPVNIVVAPALDLAKRKIETIQQLYIESDSLQFTLYDNGEVDGDTVSVALNGKTIVSRQGLNTTAFTKTVYMTPDLGDSIQLIMYAENLGTLAPNTGLLVLQYDNKRQEIRFSGDLNKNAAITLRRKLKN